MVKSKQSSIKSVILIIVILIMAVVIMFGVRVLGAGKNIVVAKRDISAGTVINEDNVSDILTFSKSKEEGDFLEIEDLSLLYGKIISKDIKADSIISDKILLDEYAPISNIADPVTIGIRADDAASFVAGTVRQGDIINVSVIDNTTKKCETILKNVYVSGAYLDDGSAATDSGCATILNILVDSSMESLVNEKISNGMVRISRMGCDSNE